MCHYFFYLRLLKHITQSEAEQHLYRSNRSCFVCLEDFTSLSPQHCLMHTASSQWLSVICCWLDDINSGDSLRYRWCYALLRHCITANNLSNSSQLPNQHGHVLGRFDYSTIFEYRDNFAFQFATNRIGLHFVNSPNDSLLVWIW